MHTTGGASASSTVVKTSIIVLKECILPILYTVKKYRCIGMFYSTSNSLKENEGCSYVIFIPI